MSELQIKWDLVRKDFAGMDRCKAMLSVGDRAVLLRTLRAHNGMVDLMSVDLLSPCCNHNFVRGDLKQAFRCDCGKVYSTALPNVLHCFGTWDEDRGEFLSYIEAWVRDGETNPLEVELALDSLRETFQDLVQSCP